jgi:hypothetical protein
MKERSYNGDGATECDVVQKQVRLLFVKLSAADGEPKPERGREARVRLTLNGKAVCGGPKKERSGGRTRMSLGAPAELVPITNHVRARIPQLTWMSGCP